MQQSLQVAQDSTLSLIDEIDAKLTRLENNHSVMKQRLDELDVNIKSMFDSLTDLKRRVSRLEEQAIARQSMINSY